MRQFKRQSAIFRLCAIACALLLPVVVLAQAAQETTAPATTPKQKPIDIAEIIVTGTRLPEPNLVSTSPVLTVDAEDIQISGRQDVSDILLLIPQNYSNSLGQDLGNRTSGLTTAGGVATADLRGLGPNRTLVLVNGRRLGIGSPNTSIAAPAPDLDQIPAPLVERVDVLTGGASAVYGSDAIAGVINFIMKRNFEGLEFDGGFGFNYADQQSSYMRNAARDFGATAPTGHTTDGQNLNASVLGGANTEDGRGNFTVYLGYNQQNPVPASHRDYGACQLNKDVDDNNAPTGTASCGGSGNSNWFQPRSGPNNGTIFSVSGTDFVDFGSVDTNPPAFFNSQPFINMSRDYKRYTAGILGHYDINDYVKPYLEFGFMNDQTLQDIAPTALFRDSNPLTADGNYLINCSNPLLSAQQRSTLCTPEQILDDTAVPGSANANVRIGRRNVEGDGRSSDYEHTNYRGVLGATGDFATAWSYDLYGQYYYTSFFNSNNQYFDFNRITNALQVTGTAANPVCVSGGTCVPYNIYSDGGVTSAQVDYLYANGTAYGTTSLSTFHVDVTGDLGEYGIKLPTASSGVAINVGYEQRLEQTQYQPDEAELSGLLSGFGGASVAVDQSIRVKELFSEMRVPLVTDKRGIANLDFNAGYRRSDYSTSGEVDTYEFGLQYAPVAGAVLRGSYQRAIRAPSIVELYNPPLVGQIQVGSDPCAPTLDDDNNVVAAAQSLQNCLNTVSAAQAAAFTAAYGNGGTTNTIPQGTAGQLSQLQGGSTELQPEEADTWSLGVTITPEIVENLTGSIDYYHIKLDKEITTLPAGPILNDCPRTGNPFFCSQLSRSPTTFGLTGASFESGGFIRQTTQNIGGTELDGIDLQVDYQLELPPAWGSLDFALAGSYQLHYKTTPYVGAHTYDCAGLFGLTCQTVNPDWHHIFRTTWRTVQDVDAYLTWRYIGSVKQDNNTFDPTLRFASYNGYDSLNRQIGSRSYFDLAATYHPLESVELRAGINNILDRAPPIITTEIISGGQANTYETYDMFGRQFFFGATMKF